MILDYVLKAVFLFGIYNILALMLFGVPESLSMTYYLFKEKSEKLKYVFPIMMTLLAFILIPCWLEISEGSVFQFTTFLAAAGIFFVGLAPAFNDSAFEMKVHSISACIAALMALLWICLVTPYWYIILIVAAVILLISLITKSIKTKYIYWLEMIAFVSTFISIITYYYNNL